MVRILAIIAVIIIAVALLVPKLKNTSVSDLPLEEKMKLAESYLQELQDEGNTFFANMKESTDVTGEVKDFNKILKKYTKRINGLHLPCPTSAETRNDPRLSGYLSWAKDFEVKDQKIMASFQQKLNQLLN